MLETVTVSRGLVSSPHHLASEAGLRVLRAGGNAIEAALAAAATIAVVCPHMNGVGGDGFWLIRTPDGRVRGIDASGRASAYGTREFYAAHGLRQIPARGPLAALTVAGAVSGWQCALTLARELGGTLPLDSLLEEAIHHAASGVASAGYLKRTIETRGAELSGMGSLVEVLLDQNGVVPHLLKQPALAETLSLLVRDGLSSFYDGPLAGSIASDLQREGSPLTAQDLAAHQASWVKPLSLKLSTGTLYNMPPPTQGVASLIILGIFDRLGIGHAEGADHVHALVEATKLAFQVRDRYSVDPRYVPSDLHQRLAEDSIGRMADEVRMDRARPWPGPSVVGDTVWLGAIDSNGCAVSLIQSLYWEFGSGMTLPETGIIWQNRGHAFDLEPGRPRSLEPGRKPFHTLNPALAELGDGRVMVYGAMGGDGRPQTQAAIYSRYAQFGQPLQRAITAPRWLLGRTWGDQTTALRLESRFDPEVIEKLRGRGHEIEMVGDFSDVMGHAGAIVGWPDGRLEGAADPRSDGQARGF